MTIKQLLQTVVKAYPVVEAAHLVNLTKVDAKTPPRPQDCGDGLLTFLLQELWETCNDEPDSEAMLNSARSTIYRAIRDLQEVADELVRKSSCE